MEAPITNLYRAGNATIPGIADRVSKAAQLVHLAIPALDVQTALAGDPPGLRAMLALSDDVHEALRRMTVSLNNCASALVATADDYRRTDQQAQRDYEQMDATLKETATEAVEVTEIDGSEDPGATQIGKTDDDRPLEEPDSTYIEPTPEPDLPNIDEEVEGRDDRIDEVEVPEEVGR